MNGRTCMIADAWRRTGARALIVGVVAATLGGACRDAPAAPRALQAPVEAAAVARDARMVPSGRRIAAASAPYSGRDLQLLFEDPNTGAIAYWIVRGGSIVQISDYGAVPASWGLVGAGDLSADGIDDLLWQHISGALSGWRMNATNGFAIVDAGPGRPADWTFRGAADFNGDGNLDFVSTDATGAVRIQFTEGIRAIGLPGTVTALTQPAGARLGAIGDVDGDGFPDLLWESPTTGERTVWRLSPDAVIHQSASTWTAVTSAALGTVPPDWRIVAVADYDDDGYGDVFWQHPASGTILIWLMHGLQYVATVSPGSPPPPWELRAVRHVGAAPAMTVTVHARTVGEEPTGGIGASTGPAWSCGIIVYRGIRTCTATFPPGVRPGFYPQLTPSTPNFLGWSGDCRVGGLAGQACVIPLGPATATVGGVVGAPAPRFHIVYSAAPTLGTDGLYHDKVYAMNADGTGVVTLSDLPLPEANAPPRDDVCPAWDRNGYIVHVVRSSLGSTLFGELRLRGNNFVTYAFGPGTPDPMVQPSVTATGATFDLGASTLTVYPQWWQTAKTSLGIAGTWPVESPDPDVLGFTAPDGTIAFLHRPSGTTYPTTVRGMVTDWSHDGTRLTYADPMDGAVQQVRVLDVHDLAHVTAGVIATPGLDARRAQWSPDGTQLAFVGRPVVGGAPTGLANVYTMLANGTGVAQATNITAGRGVGCVDWQ